MTTGEKRTAEHLIAVVEDDETTRRILGDFLADCNSEIKAFETAGAISRFLEESGPPDCLLLDVRLPDAEGLGLFEEIRANYPDLPVILITAFGNTDQAVLAMTRGAYYYFTKPLDFLLLRRTVSDLLEKTSLKRQIREITKVRSSFGIIGQSGGIREAVRRVRLVTDLPTTVLITGETGTGKELIARAIHDAGVRSSKPFVAINCAAVPDALLESELFGYEKGAFTGAGQSKPGIMEMANRGTIFLDEVGDLPMALQAKLLRVIETREVERLGAVQSRKLDLRFVVATNQDLAVMVAQGRFRRDLYFRLNSFPIHLPPLRDRLEDLPLLIFHFLQELNEICQRRVEVLEPAVMAALASHRWPGNVREVRNVLETAVICCPGRELQLRHLPPLGGGKTPPPPPAYSSLSEFEREAVIRALRDAGGNRSAAAKMLGITRNQVRYRIKKYGLDEESERSSSDIGSL